MTQLESHKQYRLIAKAIQVLEQHTNGFSTEESGIEPKLNVLAEILHTSPYHLQRTFSEWAGISPKQFFHCLQKDHALKLIAKGQSLLECTNALGFSSSSKLHHLMLKFEALTPGEIKNEGMNQTLTIGHAPSPFGQVFTCLTHKGLNSLEFETDELTFQNWASNISALYPKAKLVVSHTMAEKLTEQIFYPKHEGQLELNLHLRATPFQLQVWQALVHLPPGQFASYQQIAADIGKPKASRAVGSAVAKNPVAFLIPCHRVIQATGELGQYRWQRERKKALHLWEHGQNIRDG